MNNSTQVLFVDYCSTQPITMGRLAYTNRRIAFEYTALQNLIKHGYT